MDRAARAFGSTVSLRPSGRLEGERSDRFVQSLELLAALSGNDVVVDLVEVTALDVRTARALRAAQSRHRSLTLTNVRAGAREALERYFDLDALTAPVRYDSTLLAA